MAGGYHRVAGPEPDSASARGGRSAGRRWAAGGFLALALFATWFFADRSVRSYELLRSATEVGLPAVAHIRAWMTLGYVATTFDVPFPSLAKGVGLTGDTPQETTLGSIANSRGIAPLPFVKEVQATVAGLVPVAPAMNTRIRRERASDDVLSILLEYRYPAFALVLLVGAIGVPVPTGFSAVLAGSMAAIGEMNVFTAAAIAVGASLVGDAIGYAIGRLADESLLRRWGRWLGYTPRRKARLKRLFDRWGGLTVILSRTLVSHLSSLASLLAGISRYRFEAFIGFALLGRLLWTMVYLGLGYVIGNNIEAAGTFLGHVTGLVLSLGVIAVLGSYLAAPLLRSSRAAT